MLAAAAFLAALLAKETAVCYPLLALLVLRARSREVRTGRRWWLQHVLLLLLPLAIYGPWRYYALEQRLLRERVSSVLFNPLQDADLPGRLHGPLTILGHYARLLVLPTRLSCDYGLAVFNPHAGPEALTAVGAAALLVIGLALPGWRRGGRLWRQLATLAAMFLASYVLISNTVLLIGVALAERLMYWPSAPALLAVTLGLVSLWRRYCQVGQPLENLRRVLPALGVVLLAGLGLRSAVRCAAWKDSETLFKTDLEVPDDWEGWPELTAQRWQHHSAHLYASLGGIVVGRAEALASALAGSRPTTTRDAEGGAAPADSEREALLAAELETWTRRGQELVRRALALYSRHSDALELRARLNLLRGRREQALADLESALWLDPSDVTARHLLARLRGTAQASATRAAELLEAVGRRPRDVALRLELGALLVRLGRSHQALEHYEQAVALEPRNVAALRGYAEALLLSRYEQQALRVLERLVALAPDDWQAHANLSVLLARRDPARALRHAQIAFQLRPDHLNTRLNLAEAYALNGYRADALRFLEQAGRALSPDDPRRQAIRDRIAELRRGRP